MFVKRVEELLQKKNLVFLKNYYPSLFCKMKKKNKNLFHIKIKNKFKQMFFKAYAVFLY